MTLHATDGHRWWNHDVHPHGHVIPVIERMGSVQRRRVQRR
jgi:hypothetical protein